MAGNNSKTVGNGLDRSEYTEPLHVCGTLKSVPYKGRE